jgi:hypothetical protein
VFMGEIRDSIGKSRNYNAWAALYPFEQNQRKKSKLEGVHVWTLFFMDKIKPKQKIIDHNGQQSI